MRRLRFVAGLFVLLALSMPSATYAQQSLNLYVGGFTPVGEDSRGRRDGRTDDVLLNNLDFLLFDIKDFNGGTVGAEYLVGVGDYLDAGLGVGYYKRTVGTVDADFVNPDGSEIQQDLRLRIVPFTATVRFLPFSRRAAVQPYVGAGVGIFNWRYSEVGDFVYPSDLSIRPGRFVGSGTATGPVVLGGVRFPVSNWDIGGEIRYQRATGDLPLDQEFSSDRIDLGGWTYAATFNIRF